MFFSQIKTRFWMSIQLIIAMICCFISRYVLKHIYIVTLFLKVHVWFYAVMCTLLTEHLIKSGGDLLFYFTVWRIFDIRGGSNDITGVFSLFLLNVTILNMIIQKKTVFPTVINIFPRVSETTPCPTQHLINTKMQSQFKCRKFTTDNSSGDKRFQTEYKVKYPLSGESRRWAVC